MDDINLEHVLEDMRSLNVSYLMMARQMAQQYPELAALYLGLERDVIDRLGRLELGDVVRIGQTLGLMMFGPRIQDPDLWKEMADAAAADRDEMLNVVASRMLLADGRNLS